MSGQARDVSVRGLVGVVVACVCVCMCVCVCLPVLMLGNRGEGRRVGWLVGWLLTRGARARSGWQCGEVWGEDGVGS